MSLALRLDPKMEKRLDDLSKKTKRSKSFLAREALGHYIEELEDYYLAITISQNPGKIYTLEEVEKMCGLEDSI